MAASTGLDPGDRSSDVGLGAQQQAQGLGWQARTRAREQFDQRASDLGERVNATAADLRGVAEYLRSQGRAQPAEVAEQAAERVAHAGEYLLGNDPDRLLADVEELGRQRPWAVMLGGAVLGLAASRMLKASSSERYRQAGTHARRARADAPGDGAGYRETMTAIG